MAPDRLLMQFALSIVMCCCEEPLPAVAGEAGVVEAKF